MVPEIFERRAKALPWRAMAGKKDYGGRPDLVLIGRRVVPQLPRRSERGSVFASNVAERARVQRGPSPDRSERLGRAGSRCRRVGDGAEEAAEGGLIGVGGDLEVNLVEVYDQAEDVEM
jgi:hypothetical protein